MCMHLKEYIKNFSDHAFDLVDTDESGYLDAEEITSMIEGVAKGMGVSSPPTTEDVTNILGCLDEDGDGRVDREEFVDLIMIVFKQLLHDEKYVGK